MMTQSRRTRIKICGIRTPDAAAAAVDAGADAIGLVFVAGSPRQVNIQAALAIVRTLPPLVEPIALFADESPAVMRQTIDALGLRTVQFHGRQTPQDVTTMAPTRVIQALPFDETFIDRQLPVWRDAPAAGLLIDAPPPPDAAIAGGHGRSFDWLALRKLMDAGLFAGLPPMFLAGGLTPGNVGQAIAQVRPYAVDVSSGVESTRGVKDARLIHDFCQAVRKADALFATNDRA